MHDFFGFFGPIDEVCPGASRILEPALAVAIYIVREAHMYR
jgi:hypothetical protein